MMAQDAAHLLPIALAPDLLAIIDDLVVLDGGSRDSTPDVARSLGARVVHAPFPADGFGAQQTRAAHASRADWVLILDADEVATSLLISAIPDLIRTRRHTGWWLPRRWVVRSDDGLGWLDAPPHWPDLQPRLARRVDGVRYVGEIHQTLASSSPGSWGIARGSSLAHLDLLLNSREAREAKVLGRSGTPGFAGTESFYLWEDHPTRIAAIPGEEHQVHRAIRSLDP